MRFGLIGQLDSPSANPHCFVSKKQADLLLETGQCIYTAADGVLRKTPKYQRYVPDAKIIPGRPGAVRGLSAQVGQTLAEAVRKESEKFWAEPMLEQITEHHMPSKSPKMWRNHSGERTREGHLILTVDHELCVA
jgi:hypothetical protein